MIKNIFWDFDGVILDSMRIKGDGFIELFNNYEDKYIMLLEKYHYENGGISRFEKIRYFYNKVLKKTITEEQIIVLANEFSEIIKNKIEDKKNLIQETLVFIRNNYKKFNFHIVSGSEHNELNQLCKKFELHEYFFDICGSPIEKSILVNNLLNKYTYKTSETILIGDSKNDYEAAKINGIKFYGFNNNALINISDTYLYNYNILERKNETTNY